MYKYGLAVIEDGKLLLCRPYAFDDLIMPGGIKEGEESHIEGLRREVREELGESAILDTNSLRYIGNYYDVAAGKTDRIVEIELYGGRVSGELVASSEIKELVWFSPKDDWSQLSPIIRNKILPALGEMKLI